MSSVSFNPKYDNEKERVTKGPCNPHAGWKTKRRFTKQINENDPQGNIAKGWLFSVKHANMYVIDFDTKRGESAKSLMKPGIYEKLYEQSSYVVETGSKGLHFYFKLPDLPETFKITQKTNSITLKEQFILEGKDVSIDVITEHIITEGSSYIFDSKTYTYTSLKQTIDNVVFSNENWDYVKDVIGYDTEVKKQQEKQEKELKKKKEREEKELKKNTEREEKAVEKETKKINKIREEERQKLKQEQSDEEDLRRGITIDEILKHLDNIPNVNTSYTEWYKMGQCIKNITDNIDIDGFEIFENWSKKNPKYNNDSKSTIKLWKGLKVQEASISLKPLGVGTILYLSKLNDEDTYKKIRSSFMTLSYIVLKDIFELEVFYVELPEPTYIREKDNNIYKLTPHQLIDAYIDWKYTVGEKEYSFIIKWREDITKRRYNKMGSFPIDSECPSNVFNTYKPPIASLLPECEKVDLSIIFNHLSIISGEVEDKKKEGVDFILNFLANIIQNPTDSKGMALIIYGSEGSGKDVLFEWFGNEILGKPKYTQPKNLDSSFDKFNGILQGKLLCHIQEIDKRQFIKNEEQIKKTITSKTIEIQHKGFDPTEERNCLRFIFTTNNRDSAKISPTDRRFGIFQSDPRHIKDENYFINLVKILYTPETRKSFYDYLLNKDISNYHHTKRPQTKIYDEMKQSSLEPIIQWIVDSEIEGIDKTSSWCVRFNEWANRMNIKTQTPVAFGIKLGTWSDKIPTGIIKSVPKNVSHYHIDRTIIIEYLVREKLIDSE
jgi:hypothetical protein